MKILIVGSGPNWKEAPFEDTSFDVWAYGAIADLLPRVDAVFEMHRPDQWPNFAGGDIEAYAARLAGIDKPVWLQAVHPDIPKSLPYPIENVSALVGGQFYSSVAYKLGLVALMVDRGVEVEEVALYGLDLCTWEEWAYQRPNVNRLIGFLQGRGVRIAIPASSKLLGEPFQYGYQVHHEDLSAANALILEHLAQLNALMARMAELHIAAREAKRFNGGANPRDQQGPSAPLQ